MHEIIELRLSGAENTRSAGSTLAQSLYVRPLTLLLTGPLGAGKTTFLQGFARGLHIEQQIISPSYALEQVYQTAHWGELRHVDLYRLSAHEAKRLVESSADHDGIRCIEWADRVESADESHISLRFGETEDPQERTIAVTFEDIAIPTRSNIEEWRRDVQLPSNIVVHCDTVGSLSALLAHALVRCGTIVRPLMVQRAGELHDLMRFLDFHPGSAHLSGRISEEQRTRWKEIATHCSNASHEQAAAEFLMQRGFDAMASILRTHGLKGEPPETVEQMVLFYADKRVLNDRVVSLEERFADFAQRYGGGRESPQSRAWFHECRRIEMELFPNGAPA